MNNKGFTLVELIAVVSILGLVSVLTTPSFGKVSSTIKERNYESKKSVIEAQTKEYVEKYLKDKVYDGIDHDSSVAGINGKKLCFTVNFLIVNGIVTSDDAKEEIIINDKTGKSYSGNKKIVKIEYDANSRKLIGEVNIEDSGVTGCSVIYN